MIIAGPCSAESEFQLFQTAQELKNNGIDTLRAGLWKPRTRPNSFEGVGSKGLSWLKRVQEELNMKVSTEVANGHHVEMALSAGIDLLWIGARTTANPFAVPGDCRSIKRSGYSRINKKSDKSGHRVMDRGFRTSESMWFNSIGSYPPGIFLV